ncbi:MAG: cobalamin B12-binding domain-containing protein [Candidatus Wallbacteria bacterium]|nr:cobalamin B12-binding domain-containing protein [Candidatus Wallbacteria bacterium]
MNQRVLLSSPVRPYPLLDGRFSPFDQMTFRFTRGQDIFTMQEHTHFYGLHVLAQNAGVPVRVLEFPTMADFEDELRSGGYGVVGITTNVVNLETVQEMCRVARRVSPGTRVVVGGYGTRCLADGALKHLRVGKEVDDLCTGDGIRFLRRLLGMGEPPRPISCRLPLCGSALPWLNPRLPGNSGTILSGLGCTTKCSFCATSAQYEGKYLEVLDAPGILHAMKRYWRSSRSVNFVAILDENLLNQKAKWSELGRLIREDEELGLGTLNYLMFASADHVSAIEPEELLLAGVDGVWIGVESCFTQLEKRRGTDLAALFSTLHAHGINTVGSTIFGFDFHSPENVEADIEYYAGLAPTLQQVGILNVVPPTADWARMRREGRLVNEEKPQERNIYGNTFRHQHFTHDALRQVVERAYRRSYERNGPAVLRFLDVSLAGYETCIRSRHALLAGAKASLFRRRLETYAPMADVVAEHGPSEWVRERALDLGRRSREILRPDARTWELTSGFLRKRADSERRRFEREGLRRREEPFRRYTYGETSGEIPYRVEFPEPLGKEGFFSSE